MDFNFKYGGAFELYGADFLLSYDLNPWLIEINSSPALGATTAVTSRLCSALLEDVIKVTVDRKKSRNADTGAFELVRGLFLFLAKTFDDILGQTQLSKFGVSFQVYKQACVQPPLFVGTSLVVQGVKVKIDSHGKGGKMSKSYSKFFQNYYPTSPLGGDGSTPTKDANGKVRLSPSQDDLKAMMAQAHRSVYRYEQIQIQSN